MRRDAAEALGQFVSHAVEQRPRESLSFVVVKRQKQLYQMHKLLFHSGPVWLITHAASGPLIEVTAKSLSAELLNFMRLKWPAIVYFLFLALIVFLADQKQYLFLFRFVRQTPGADKAGHFILMGLFSLLVNLALSCQKIKVGKLALLAGSLLARARRHAGRVLTDFRSLQNV